MNVPGNLIAVSGASRLGTGPRALFGARVDAQRGRVHHGWRVWPKSVFDVELALVVTTTTLGENRMLPSGAGEALVVTAASVGWIVVRRVDERIMTVGTVG